jgi:hypothetical protein
MLEEAFGVQGELGNLILQPKLLRGQFDENGEACVNTEFGGKKLRIIYKNPGRLDYGKYSIEEILIDGIRSGENINQKRVLLSKDCLSSLSDGEIHVISVGLKA